MPLGFQAAGVGTGPMREVVVPLDASWATRMVREGLQNVGARAYPRVDGWLVHMLSGLPMEQLGEFYRAREGREYLVFLLEED